MRMPFKRLKKPFLFLGCTLLIFGTIGFITIYSFGYTPPILMYHHIRYERASQSRLVVSPRHFEKQLQYLKDQKYNVISLDKLFLLIAKQNPIPSKTISITIDDGYEDNYTYAFPILKKFGFPATIFLTVDAINSEGYLTIDQIQEMEKRGIRFGNHTLTHPHLTGIHLQEARYEIMEAEKKLREIVKAPSRIFCYPFGEFNENIVKLVTGLGYSGAVATSPNGKTPLDDLYGFRRIRISSSANDLHIFWFESSGYYGFVGQMRKKIRAFKDDVSILF